MISSEAIIGVIGTLAGTILGFLLERFSRRGKLNFFDASVEYHYSYYDAAGNHSHVGEQKIYEILVSVGVYNSADFQKIIRSAHVEGVINDKKYYFNLFDLLSSTWQTGYNIDGKSQREFSWKGMPQGHGIVTGDPGIIPFTLINDEMTFEFIYRDEKSKIVKVGVNSIRGARLNPRLIGS